MPVIWVGRVARSDGLLFTTVGEGIMRNLISAAVSVILGMCVLATAARADEEKIELDKLPKAVIDAVKKKFPDAELKSAEKEKEGGKEVFEVVIKNKDQNLEVIVSPEGKILAVEKEIAVKDLPKAVTEAVDAKYPKSSIKKAEEVTKDDKVTYEVLIETADKKKLEVELDPKGKFVEREKKEENKKEDKK
jgi:uncharacterized membrane protein YkoI